MKVFQSVSILLMVSGIGGCAGFTAENLFSDYATQHSELHQSLKNGDYSQAQEDLDQETSGDEILAPMEKGRVYALNHDYQQSRDLLQLSDQAVRKQQDLATISLSREAVSFSSLFANDNLNAYVPADYELGFLHLYLALSYVNTNNLQDALVELRRANQVQEHAKKIREDVLKREQQELKEQGIQPDLGSLLSDYPDAGTSLQAVQNGYLFYLSALLYEAAGELNDAYVDYRRALAVSPDNHEVIQGTIRCARKLGMREDLNLLLKRYGKTSQSVSPHHSRVILIQEQGVVDQLQGWQQLIPVFHENNNRVYSLALPYYQSYLSPAGLPVQLNQAELRGTLLTDINLMARYHLKERLPAIVFRQILRLIAKNSLRHGLDRQDSKGIANLLVNVWNVVTEQPDTRSWSSLPASVFSLGQIVPSGEQKIVVGGQAYSFNAPEQATVLVWISRQGNNSVIWHKVLGRL